MNFVTRGAYLLLGLTLLAGQVCAGNQPASWAFATDATGKPPAGFSFGRTGEGREGRWEVVTDATAPAGKVLAQLDADDTDYRFPVAVAERPSFADVDLSVRCKAVSGKVDQGMGLVARYRDANNYYLTRANALEDNVNLYKVVDGRRKQIAGWRGTVSPGTWHTLRLVVRGDHLQVFFDDHPVIEARDATFRESGKLGVWTKADSVTYFTDLKAAPPR